MILKTIQKAVRRLRKSPPTQGTYISHQQHRLPDANISRNAMKVLKKLKDHGFDAYLVGGGVRDLLLDKHPKDFDIATDAKPEQIRKVFRNCRLIGRRFRLAHIYFGRDIIEVATFRRSHDSASKTGQSRNGMIVRDNVYGNIEEDALRRDFTVNALYYDIKTRQVIDFCDGIQDLNDGLLRLIGTPKIRYTEDPVRMLRAARLAAKLNLKIEAETEHAIYQNSELLQHISPARLFDESVKLFSTGHAKASFDQLVKYDLFKQLFAQTAEFLKENPDSSAHQLIELALVNTDNRVKQGKSVNPAFIIAVFLWHPMQTFVADWLEKGMPKYPAFDKAISQSLAEQAHNTAIPRRLTLVVREMWTLQHRLHQQHSKKALNFVGHPRFRAAYDFFLLRAECGEVPMEEAEWWTTFQDVDVDTRVEMIEQQKKLEQKQSGKRRPRRRRR